MSVFILIFATYQNEIMHVKNKMCKCQARSQGTFEVEALSGRGFGGCLEAPNGSRAKPWWGPRGRSPRKLMDITYLQSSFLR